MSECPGPGCNHPGCNGDRRGTSSEPGSADDLNRRLADVRDPIVKYDGQGNPVRVSQIGNRRERREWAKKARKGQIW